MPTEESPIRCSARVHERELALVRRRHHAGAEVGAGSLPLLLTRCSSLAISVFSTAAVRAAARMPPETDHLKTATVPEPGPAGGWPK